MATESQAKKPRMPDLESAAREILERIVLRCGSFRSLGVRCGSSRMWVWRQLRQNKGLVLGKIAKALASLAVPPRFFLEELTETLPAYDPVWVLEHFCPRRAAGDPFLAKLESRFRRLLEYPSTPSAGTFRRHREIEALEEKILFDPQAAKAELEILGRDLLVAGEAAIAGGQGLSRGYLVDCARLLLVLGKLQSATGSRAGAVAALALAHELGLATGDAATLGLFFTDAARLLSELGQPGLALRFAQAAVRHFQTLRDRRWVPSALLQISHACGQLGQPREARIHAIAALRLDTRDRWGIRPAAWLQLADLATARGHFGRAFGLLERAKKNSRKGELQPEIHARQAVLLVHLGRTEKAAKVFGKALKHFNRQAKYLEIAGFATDLAEALILKGRFAATLELVRATTPHFERLGVSEQAPALWMDLCALILDGHRQDCRKQVLLVRQALPSARIHPRGLGEEREKRLGRRQAVLAAT